MSKWTISFRHVQFVVVIMFFYYTFIITIIYKYINNI